MDFNAWDAMVTVIIFCIRLIFWPIGLLIKFRVQVMAVLPYLVLGVVAVIVGLLALGVLSMMFQVLFLVVKACVVVVSAVVSLFRSGEKTSFTNSSSSSSTSDQSQQHYRQHREESSSDEGTPDPYEILGVPRTVSQSELNARYRQLLRVNHPDKVAQLDPEIQAFATERARKIIEAYEAICSEEEEMGVAQGASGGNRQIVTALE